MEPAVKLRRLADIRQQLPYLSHTALSAVCTLAQEEDLPRCSRHDVRKARDAIVKVDAPYGCLIKTKSVAGVNDTVVNFDIICPFAYMWAAASRRRWADIVERALIRSPPTVDQPWTLLMYADEVTPGNIKKSDNQKRIQGMYWCLKELGPDALAKEDVWATISALRSTRVGTIDGGMSAVMAVLLKSFFSETGHNMEHGGCRFTLHGRDVRIWVKFGGFIADESALHGIWLCKGASGIKMCVICMNMVNKNWIGGAGLDADSFLKPFNRIFKCHLCELHTKETIQHIVDTLAADKPFLTVDAFKAKQMALGFSHNPHSILLDPALRGIVDPATQTFFDWPHSILQGVFPVQLSLLEARLAVHHVQLYKFLDEYLQGWSAPKLKSGSGWRGTFNARRRDTMISGEKFKASMSETLALHPIIGHWLRTVVLSQGHFVDLCQAYFDLSDFIDLLHAAGRGNVKPKELVAGAEKFLASHAAAYGVDDMIPKFHHSLHLHMIVERIKTLPTTLPLERKHKVLKMFAEAFDNTGGTWDTSVLVEVTFKALGVLDGAEHLRLGPGLISAKEQVPARALTYLQEHLGHLVFEYASQARYSSEGSSSAGDVVAYKADGGTWLPGVVHFFFSASGHERALVSLLKYESHERTYSRWKHQHACVVIALDDIITSTTFRLEGDVYTLLHPWSLQR